MAQKLGMVYVVCPRCKTQRKKGGDKKWTIIKRGQERNKIARFFCRNCGAWFNDHTGLAMEWYER